MDEFYSYLAGLYTADGWRQDNRLGWETKDKSWIQKISKLLGVHYHYRQRIVKTGTLCDMYSLSTKIPSQLVMYDSGYKNFKAWFLHTSEINQDNYIKGFFDGDGSVCYYANSNRVRIIFYTVEDFTYDIVIYYLNNLNIKYSVSRDNRGHSVTQISVGRTRDIYKLFKRWYGTVYLDRKYQLMYDSLKSQPVYLVDNGDVHKFYLNREDIVKRYSIANSSISNLIEGVVPTCHGYSVKKMSLEQSGFPTQVIEY